MDDTRGGSGRFGIVVAEKGAFVINWMAIAQSITAYNE